MTFNALKAIALVSATGFTVEIVPYGATITKILALDKNGKRENVVLAYDNPQDYWTNPLFLGCAVGPIAGRTRNGQIKTDSETLLLDTRTHPNALHSGSQGFHQVAFSIATQSQDTLVLTHTAEMQSLFKADIRLNITLTFQALGESLVLKTHVTTNKTTYLSMTNHTYFNLSGKALHSSISNHLLQLKCSHFARLDEASLPIELIPLEGSAFDFRDPVLLSEVLGRKEPDLIHTAGIDHPFKCAAIEVARLYDPCSGRLMCLETTQPYVVIYSGNFLDTYTSVSGTQFTKHAGICFETQDLPDVANNRLDAMRWVSPESPYEHQTSFSFKEVL